MSSTPEMTLPAVQDESLGSIEVVSNKSEKEIITGNKCGSDLFSEDQNNKNLDISNEDFVVINDQNIKKVDHDSLTKPGTIVTVIDMEVNEKNDTPQSQVIIEVPGFTNSKELEVVTEGQCLNNSTEFVIDKTPDFITQEVGITVNGFTATEVKKITVNESKASVVKTTQAFKSLTTYYGSDSEESSSSDSSCSDDSTSEDSESDSPDSELSNDTTDTLSSDGEEVIQTADVNKRRPVPQKKKKNDLFDIDLSTLPKIEDLHISLPESSCIEIGRISSIVELLVVVGAYKNTPALDIGSVLFLDKGNVPLGAVYDVIGAVQEPAYLVRFNSMQHISSKGISTGMIVYYAPQSDYTSFVFVPDLLKMKGSDASWMDNTEPPPECQDFSDDEEEKRVRRKFNSYQRKSNYTLESNQWGSRKIFRQNSSHPRLQNQQNGAHFQQNSYIPSYSQQSATIQQPFMSYRFTPIPRTVPAPPTTLNTYLTPQTSQYYTQSPVRFQPPVFVPRPVSTQYVIQTSTTPWGYSQPAPFYQCTSLPPPPPPPTGQ